MKVRKMIELLQRMNPEDEVYLHHYTGNKALYIVKVVNINIPETSGAVVIEDKDDNDMGEELDAMFKHAVDTGMDELDFFMGLIDVGITLEDIKEFLPEQYEYSKKFMEEHGLI